MSTRPCLCVLAAVAALTLSACAPNAGATSSTDPASGPSAGAADDDAAATAARDDSDDSDDGDDGDTPPSTTPDGLVIGTLPTTTVPLDEFGPQAVEPRFDQVAVVGDSLTVSATEEIEVALTRLGIEPVVIDALEGRRLDAGGVEPGTDAIERLLADDVVADAWVIALGTNDLGTGSAGVTAAADALLDLLPVGVPVIWVDTYVDGRTDASESVNAVIGQLTHHGVAVEVVEWSAVATEPGMLVGDGVHLTPTGQRRFAEVIADALLAP